MKPSLMTVLTVFKHIFVVLCNFLSKQFFLFPKVHTEVLVVIFMDKSVKQLPGPLLYEILKFLPMNHF